MSNVISSLIFAHRNIDKTQNGDIGRAPVAAAQCINVLNAVSKYNKAIAHGTDAAVSVFKDMAKTSKTADYAIKGISWATKNVNPMIAASGVLKVAMSDDKVSTGITEISALSTMFAGEKLANKGLEALGKINWKNPKIAKLFNKNTRIGALLHGILFVSASIASYATGEYMGKNLAEEVKNEFRFKNDKIDQMA